MNIKKILLFMLFSFFLLFPVYLNSLPNISEFHAEIDMMIKKYYKTGISEALMSEKLDKFIPLASEHTKYIVNGDFDKYPENNDLTLFVPEKEYHEKFLSIKTISKVIYAERILMVKA